MVIVRHLIPCALFPVLMSAVLSVGRHDLQLKQSCAYPAFGDNTAVKIPVPNGEELLERINEAWMLIVIELGPEAPPGA